ncbi:MAG: T9SS type A sorting domain-containing protein [Bacteroidia bacterium]
MKRILTLLAVLSIKAFSYGQTIHIYDSGSDVTGDTIIVPIMAGDMDLNDLELHNTSSSKTYYKINRTIGMKDSCANIYYCTGTQCYSPNNATTWTPSGGADSISGLAILPSGPGTYGIAAHYDACPTMCHDFWVLYRVYNTMTAGDTAKVTIMYMCTSGIDENDQQEVSVAAYPNPASNFVSINYDVKNAFTSGRITITDMLGKQVNQLAVNGRQGTAKLDVSEMPAGIYFYSLIIDNNTMSTKKLIVTSK